MQRSMLDTASAMRRGFEAVQGLASSTERHQTQLGVLDAEMLELREAEIATARQVRSSVAKHQEQVDEIKAMLASFRAEFDGRDANRAGREEELVAELKASRKQTDALESSMKVRVDYAAVPRWRVLYFVCVLSVVTRCAASPGKDDRDFYPTRSAQCLRA